MKQLVDLYGEPRNWAVNRDVYFEALRDVPERLLDTAAKHCIRSSAFFPKPAELRAAITHELADHRRRMQEHLSAMQALPPPVDSAPPSAEDIAYVERIVAEMNARMRERSDKTWPATQTQDGR
jgi:hypothetical protein